MALQLRRGTNAQRLAVTPVDGELIFVTDWQSASVTPLWLGDGSTVGGIPANSGIKLDDLTDVVIASVAANQHLQYDSATSKWINVSNMTIPGTVAATGAYLDQVNVGITDANTIDTQSGDLKLDAATNNVLVNANLNVDSGVLYVDATTNRVGVNTTTPLYEVDAVGTVRGQTGVIAGSLSLSGNTIQSNNSAGLSITGNTGGDVKIFMDDLHIDAGGTAASSALRFHNNAAAISYNNTSGFFELNKPAAMNGDLYINGPTISSLSSNINLDAQPGRYVNVVRDLVVGGNLTVNGDLTYLNVSDLQVEDKNIILAKGSTTDVAADGGGITLKGTTDKSITWSDSLDKWTYDNGDGVTRPFVGVLDDLSDVSLYNPSIAAGQLLVHNGTAWWNSTEIRFDTTAYRTRFANNASDSVEAAEFLNYASTLSDGAASGVLLGHVDSSQTKTYSHRLLTEYDSGNNHIFRVQVDPTNNFAAGSNTAYAQLRISDTSFDVHSTTLKLDANNSGSASTASFVVSRGISADATLTWDEGQLRWEFNNPLEVQGQITGTANLDLNGTSILLNSGYATGRTSGITVERGSTGADATFKWDETFDSWVASDTLAANYIVGYTNLATNGYNIIFNNADTTPTDTDHANLLVKRGSGPDVAIRWNESLDRWQFTNDGSTYISLSAGLEPGDSPTIAGLTAGNVTVGVVTDNTISTTTGDLTISSATGTTNVTGTLAASTLTAGATTVTGLTVNSVQPAIQMGTGLYSISAFQPLTTTSTSTVDLQGVGITAFRSVEFTLQATRGTEFQIVKGVAIHDGTNTWINTYSDIKTGANDLFGISATIASGSMKLQVTSTSATSTVYKGSFVAYAV